MPELSNSVGEIADALRAIFGLTRRNRTRDQIGELVGLYAKLSEHEGLSTSAAYIAEAIDHQSQQLKEVHVGPARKIDWSDFAIGIFFTGISVWGLVVLWPARNWWTISGFIVLAIFALLAAVTTITNLEGKDSN